MFVGVYSQIISPFSIGTLKEDPWSLGVVCEREV